MLDFSLIETSEEFEMLCEDLLIAKGFFIETRPSRGQDHGADIIAHMFKTDSLGFTESLRVLVECKHFAKSNQSVREDNVKNIVERTLSNNCARYLLITSTMPSTSVNHQIKNISNNPTIGISAAF